MFKIKVLELFSGIGGMHFALKLAGLDAEVVAAVDINPNANAVYRHNFKNTKVLQKTIEIEFCFKGIKIEDYEKLDFDMILMSPPCQPFTRQGNQNGLNDARAKSFLSLIELIPKLRKKPQFILMENVKGFEEDEARKKFIDMLNCQNYYFQEFLLSPIQLGIPNSRLRYFLIARLDSPFSFETSSKIENDLPEIAKQYIAEMSVNLKFNIDKNTDVVDRTKSQENVNEIYADLRVFIKKSQINEEHKSCSQSESAHILVDQIKNLIVFVDNRMGNRKDLLLSDEFFFKSVNIMDLVSVDSTRTSCFTKNYGRFLEGTGSLLRIGNENHAESEKEGSIEINRNSIRFFSPKEIANLHCFPDEFEFPKNLSTLQQWKLIGNSLNVLIVGVLLKLLTC